MSPIKAFIIGFVAVCLLMTVNRVCLSLDRLTTALHESCLIGDGSPPRHLNNPDRKPFSYRK